MIAEIIPQAYDAEGKQVSQPFWKRKGPHPTFPMGRYVSQPLTVKCGTILDVRRFLAGCKYVSDKELFDREDYWQPPEEFEQRKQGDCEDFALWTWRQLLSMGYDARFVGGSAGRYGAGHAWVEYFEDGKCYLLEPLANRVGAMPRLSTLRYSPKLSVSWDGKTIRYFSHKKPNSPLTARAVAPLLPDYLIFWAFLLAANFFRLPRTVWKLLRRHVFRRELWLQHKTR
ncbi:MAG: transglutaminase domain-containing protein [Candidatus Sulfotelmatobacter sp.]